MAGILGNSTASHPRNVLAYILLTITTTIGMASFLRKKNKNDDKKNRQPPEPAILQQQSSTSPTPPLYARFATSTSTSSDASSPTSRPVVSGPMSLASSRKSLSGGSSERGGASNPYGRSFGNGNNAKWNVSGSVLRMKREQSGQSSQSIASGSGVFPSTSTQDSSLPGPQFATAGNGSTSKLGRGSPAAYGSSLGVESVSRVSLDTPLPAPKPKSQPIRQPPLTPRIRDPATPGDKPLPTPGPVIPTSPDPEALSPSLASEAKKSRATKRLSDDLSNNDVFSLYPDILAGYQRASNMTKLANTNTVSSPFASVTSSPQAGPLGYPIDLLAQFTSQPISNSSEPLSSYPSTSSFTDGRSIPPTSNSKYPSNPSPSQTKPPSPKKSGFPSLKGRVTTNLYGQSVDNGPNPDRISLDDPNWNVGRTKGSLEQPSGEVSIYF